MTAQASHFRIEARFRLQQGSFALQVDLQLPGRGVSALLGPSGSGKTSLLRAIAGLERHRGFLAVNGETWQDDEQGVFLPTHRRALGYVFQEASLLPHLTVQGNLDFGWRRSAAAGGKVDRAQILTLLGIDGLLDRQPDKLSGGERQRVAIARALITRPRLLLMDEPLASLDAARKQEVLPYLERIHDALDIPMIYVSHAQDEVARLADHVVLLGAGADAGKVVASGPIAEIAARLDLPLALEEGAGAVVEGAVLSYDAHYRLARVQLAGGEVQVVHGPLAVGSHLRLRILARDVSLSLAPQEDISMLNQLPVRVLADMPGTSAAHVMLRLDAGGTPLLARITRQSFDRLQIAPGKQVWAQFKAVAVFSGS